MSASCVQQEIELDVFGQRMKASFVNQRWYVFYVAHDGKFRPVHDVVVPCETQTEMDLIIYLDDLFHEMATDRHRHVRLVS